MFVGKGPVCHRCCYRCSELAASLAGTVSFLKTLGCLYDSFGIHCRGEASEGCTLEKAKTNATAIRNC